ncbi:hypothetical protein [Maricaulis sp.]|uniref:hypothetical protein n=1 Tax=Maricaulis sp. TaxID=1486257 RepID=UPI003A932CD6|tara:strand:- start:1077 stop:1493 length:417 start_codon:yes stop_codon:yes gene_type:complete
MMLVLLLAGSLTGVAAMVALNHWLGLAEPACLRDLDEAVERLDTDAVGFDAGEAVLAEDGTAALVEAADGSCIGLLAARGDQFVIRYLKPGLVQAARIGEGGQLTIRLEDFTFAPVVFPFGASPRIRHWADKLNALQG